MCDVRARELNFLRRAHTTSERRWRATVVMTAWRQPAVCYFRKGTRRWRRRAEKLRSGVNSRSTSLSGEGTTRRASGDVSERASECASEWNMSKGLARLRLAWMESIFIKARKSPRWERVTRMLRLRKIVTSFLFFKHAFPRLAKIMIMKRPFLSRIYWFTFFNLSYLLSFVFNDILNYHYYSILLLCSILWLLFTVLLS